MHIICYFRINSFCILHYNINTSILYLLLLQETSYLQIQDFSRKTIYDQQLMVLDIFESNTIDLNHFTHRIMVIRQPSRPLRIPSTRYQSKCRNLIFLSIAQEVDTILWPHSLSFYHSKVEIWRILGLFSYLAPQEIFLDIFIIGPKIYVFFSSQNQLDMVFY